MNPNAEVWGSPESWQAAKNIIAIASIISPTNSEANVANNNKIIKTNTNKKTSN